MPAKIHFRCGREPAEIECIILGTSHQKSRLRELHLIGHILHPCLFGSLFEKHNTCGIPSVRHSGECINVACGQ